MPVGVHTPQREIRDVGRFELVLRLAVEVMDGCATGTQCASRGWSHQPRSEAALARDLGYHAGLLSLAAWRSTSNAEFLEYCRAVAKETPVAGYDLQEAVGGMRLSRTFWQGFAEIENVVAIKMAPFSRYRRLDIICGLVAARQKTASRFTPTMM